MPVYDKTYIKGKVREFDSKIMANLFGDRVSLGDRVSYALYLHCLDNH